MRQRRTEAFAYCAFGILYDFRSVSSTTFAFGVLYVIEDRKTLLPDPVGCEPVASVGYMAEAKARPASIQRGSG